MTSIFVAKLDFGVTSDQLKQVFQSYGAVLKATVATDRETGKSRGFGFVEMANREEAMNAIKQLDGYQFNGRPMTVKEAEQRQDNRPPRDSNFQKRDFKGRDSGSFKAPGSGGFQKREQGSSESPYKKPTERPDRDFTPPVAPIDPTKLEGNRKKDKEKDKKSKDWGEVDRSKKTKMSAYKKSGKNNRFLGEDDDDDWDDNMMDNYVDQSYGDDEYIDDEDNYVDDNFDEDED